jgi:hypothetical protein
MPQLSQSIVAPSILVVAERLRSERKGRNGVEIEALFVAEADFEFVLGSAIAMDFPIVNSACEWTIGHNSPETVSSFL